MSPDFLFQIANTAVMPFWLLLVVAPGWGWTQRLTHSAIVALALTPIYVFGFATSSGVEGGSFGSLEGVMLLFRSPEAVLSGWIHYLVFDLFVGAWEARDARRRGLPHWLVVPCLLLTLMLGPIGLCLYLVVRGIRGEGWSLVESDLSADPQAA